MVGRVRGGGMMGTEGVVWLQVGAREPLHGVLVMQSEGADRTQTRLIV